MKDQLRTLTIFLSLASIIIVLNNCKEATFARNQNETMNDFSNPEESSIFQARTTPDSNSGNTDDEEPSTIIRRTSQTVDPVLFAETVNNFMNLANRSMREEDILEFLVENGVEPQRVLAEHFDGLEDKITIITRKPLSGMKFIRLTFIVDGDGVKHLQRATFDLPKSDTALVDTVTFLEDNFNGIGERHTVEHSDYVVRYYFDGYVLRVRQNFWSDIKGNPINLYTEAHIGTITVTLEYDIHNEDH